MPSIRTLSAIGLSLLIAAAVQAQTSGQWKWRDSTGNIQYSDRPPPLGTPEKDILARPLNAKRPVQLVPFGVAASAPASAPADPALAAATRRDADQKARQASESEAKLKADEQRQAALRAENCKAARNQLATLESGVRVAQVNDKGERIVLDDAARATEMTKAKAVIASECK